MICIKASRNYLKITGHEESSTKNKLLCCSVSAISLTALNTFRKEDLIVVSKKGFLKARLLNDSYKNKTKWWMFIQQLYFIYLTANNNQIKWG